MSEINAAILEDLFKVVSNRKNDDPSTSYTAKLFSKGVEKIAQKVGEEATEVVIESIKGDQKALTSESPFGALGRSRRRPKRRICGTCKTSGYFRH